MHCIASANVKEYNQVNYSVDNKLNFDSNYSLDHSLIRDTPSKH